MENDIVGERLKGLYNAINEVCSKKFLENILQFEVKNLM